MTLRTKTPTYIHVRLIQVFSIVSLHYHSDKSISAIDKISHFNKLNSIFMAELLQFFSFFYLSLLNTFNHCSKIRKIHFIGGNHETFNKST